jgi:hypothetical protein
LDSLLEIRTGRLKKQTAGMIVWKLREMNSLRLRTSYDVFDVRVTTA